jgi:hypothetical protein
VGPFPGSKEGRPAERDVRADPVGVTCSPPCGRCNRPRRTQPAVNLVIGRGATRCWRRRSEGPNLPMQTFMPCSIMLTCI